MKDEPEIVKDLRRSEKLGRLSSKVEGATHEIFKELNLDDDFLKNNVEENKEIFGYEKEINQIPTENKDGTLYKIVVENSSEGILITDSKGEILFVNPAVTKIFGFKSSKESIGKNMMDFIKPVNNKKGIKNQSLTSIGNGDFSDIFKALTANGKEKRIDCIGTKIKYKNKIVNAIFIRDVTQRQKKWDKLIKLKEKYRVFAETSADGILTIDTLGRLTYVNPYFEKMCMQGKNKILMTPFKEYLSDESAYLFQQNFINAWRMDKKIENMELELIKSNNSIIPVEVNISPLKKDDEFTGIVCTVRDITERKKIEKEFKKSERLKTEFMNIAAHELKSPVTPIKGYLDLIISDGETNEKIKNWAKISLRNSERLLKLVNDILDVSRLDSGSMKFDMEKLNPVKILYEIVEDMKPAVESKNLGFIVHIPKNLPDIIGDHFRLLQVLRNIISNAIKFTDNGHISVEAKKEKGYVLISIKDTGIGIPNDELKKIFSKFHQAHMGNDRKHDGTGLGLFICKEIIGKHNGKIWVESTFKKGSKFFIKLPYL